MDLCGESHVPAEICKPFTSSHSLAVFAVNLSCSPSSRPPNSPSLVPVAMAIQNRPCPPIAFSPSDTAVRSVSTLRHNGLLLQSIAFLLIPIMFSRRFFPSLLLLLLVFSSLAADAFRSHFRDLRRVSNFATAGDEELSGISNLIIEVASSQRTRAAGNITCTQRTALTLRLYEIFKARLAVSSTPPGTMNV